MGKTLHCSFCGKDQNQIEKLIAGPKVYICNECIDICNDIIAGKTTPHPPPPSAEQTPPVDRAK